MLTQIKNVMQADEKKRLFSNIFSLGVLQGANYLFPLITAPYLIRVLGPEYYGLIAFSAATVAYFTLLTDYGFNLSATQQIALNRDDPPALNAIFSSVMIVKTLLMIISFALLCLLLFSFERFAQDAPLYLITFIGVIGQMLFPVWLFQGMETMKYITYVNVATKAFFTVAIFIFVQSQSDYMWVPLLTGVGSVFAGLWSLYFVRKVFGIQFSWQPIAALKVQLIDGWHIFLSTIVMSLYTTSTTFILGLFTNNTIVGYFAAADKVILAAKGLFTPVVQALYPMLSKRIKEDQNRAMKQVEKVSFGMGAYTLAVSILLWFFAQDIVLLLFGETYQSTVILLKIMAFLPFLIALSNIFGLLVMINAGYKKQFTWILTASAILGLALSVLLVPVYAAQGSAITMLVVECFVTLAMFVFLKKQKMF